MKNKQNHNVITVFGGTGFLGRHIIYALAKTGATIRVPSRLKEKAYFLKPAGNPGQIVPIHCNVYDDASVAATLKGATHAVNLIGILYERGKFRRFQNLHVDVAERIARMAKAENLDLLVHMSSLGASLDSPSRYAQSKALGENKVIHTFGKSVILRPSVAFGPEDEFFNRFAYMARFSPALPLIGGGTAKFQPVYVGDIAQAVTKIITHKSPSHYAGQIFELGGPRVYTFKELMELLRQTTGQNVGLMTLPIWFAKITGFFANLLFPEPPLTVDQVRLLQMDNVLSPHGNGLADLGITPTTIESVLPVYLDQYRAGGPFSKTYEAP